MCRPWSGPRLVPCLILIVMGSMSTIAAKKPENNAECNKEQSKACNLACTYGEEAKSGSICFFVEKGQSSTYDTYKLNCFCLGDGKPKIQQFFNEKENALVLCGRKGVERCRSFCRMYTENLNGKYTPCRVTINNDIAEESLETVTYNVCVCYDPPKITKT